MFKNSTTKSRIYTKKMYVVNDAVKSAVVVFTGECDWPPHAILALDRVLARLIEH